MEESIKEADFIGVWYNPFEDYVIKKYCSCEYNLTHRQVFDFWEYEIPFTYGLKGKKVLVVHPFQDTIESQYNNRDKLFKNEKVLPVFTLITVKAVQTCGNASCGYASWFEALEAMFVECMSKDFDIALIGCGAYGLPLAAKLKKEGKTAIHMGGVLQILFGIKGNRWDNHPTASKLYNEYWVRPSENERPKGAEDVEGACYW